MGLTLKILCSLSRSSFDSSSFKKSFKDKARCTLAGGHHLDDRADFDTGVQLAVNDAESVEPVGYGGDYRVAPLAHCDSTVVN